MTYTIRCSICHGNAGQLIEGAHALCKATQDQGLPIPEAMGKDKCLDCNGSGRTPKPGQGIQGYALTAAHINAAFPKCTTCNGSGTA